MEYSLDVMKDHAHMTWEVEFTDEFDDWWDALGSDEQVSIDA
jgi:hypothetical protein